MRVSVRTTFAALSIACLAASAGTLFSQPALAQAAQQGAPAQPLAGQPPQLKQVALSEKQIDNVLAAQKDMEAITDKLPESTSPDAKAIARLEAVAKKQVQL